MGIHVSALIAKTVFIVAGAVVCSTAIAATPWRPVDGNLMTRWVKDVNPANPWSEYPRPQMIRSQWQSLNGLWNYAVTDKDAAAPSNYSGQILVPYPIESALSGVKRPLLPTQNLWYQREFVAPVLHRRERLLLHFGAADFEATVILNGHELGTHSGGYQSFSFDLTQAIKRGRNELKAKVWDPTDEGQNNPHGKQRLKPGGIFYTASSGIWQTVWLEVVPQTFIDRLDLTPDVDHGTISINVRTLAGDGYTVEASSGTLHASGVATEPLFLAVPNPHLWSPEDPYVYSLEVRLLKGGAVVDRVRSYFGMRKIEVKEDPRGQKRIFLNGQYTFNLGTLDQGYWPDGLYTAPTDAAMQSDIQTIKAMGFNTIRKHLKIEPDRWYYYCDRLGLMVWQDMVPPAVSESDYKPTAASRSQFEDEIRQNIAQLYDHPSITTWVLFNEGGGAYDQAHLEKKLKQLDASRLVNGQSGQAGLSEGPILVYLDSSPGPDGDLADVHSYPGPALLYSESKAMVLGEYGGVGVPIDGHTWRQGSGWGYVQVARDKFASKYAEMMVKLKHLEGIGLSGSIYTEPFDVETELNGLVTYDREISKIPLEDLAQMNSTLIEHRIAASVAGDIDRTSFGKLPDGVQVDLYTLRNSRGMEARITNYGGIVTQLTAPDRRGIYADVVLGYDTLDEYLKASPYFGALIGRYANRLAHGKFTVDQREYQVATNDGPNALNGGLKGFDKVVWTVVSATVTPNGPQLILTYLSPDGEEGYPGNLRVTAVYTLTKENALRLNYSARSDKDTIINLTQHTYFNLRGKDDVLEHEVEINADQFTPIDGTLIPTGEIKSVDGTPFDFRRPTAIGARIAQADEQLQFAHGYDHNWVTNKTEPGLALQATVFEPETGRVLQISSTEPGFQFYSGNFLDSMLTGKGGWIYGFRNAFAAEPQHFPDSPNHPNFPSVILRTGETYHSTIVYQFSSRSTPLFH
jgi:galactose mutarotase-like enzyme